MTTQTEALKLALDLATMHHTDDGYAELRSKVRQLAKEALAQPEQEPDVYIPADALRQLKGTSLLILRSVPLYGYRGDGLTPLYTTQPQRKPLTHEQRFDLLTKFEPHKNKWEAPAILIDMVEAAHGIKE